MKMQGPRSSRDRILQYLSDGCWHLAFELDRDIPEVGRGEWVPALADLIDFGYEFHRRGNSLFMQKRRYGEPVQDIAELLAGIDATVDDRLPSQRSKLVAAKPKPEKDDPPPEVEAWRDEEALDDSEPFPPGTAEPVLAETDRLTVSVDGACILSARQHVTSTKAILAKKRVGKTYLAMVIAEEMMRLSLPFIVLDPTGVWWGLNATADGQAAPKAILVLGGLHGAFPLDYRDGDRAAELAVEMWPLPVVLDVSEMIPEEQHEFAADFGAKLYAINKHAVHLIVDEADEFAPQTTDSNYKHQRRCLGVFDRCVRRGGVKGIGVTVITQRPAVIHKNILSQVDGIFVLQMAAPHDLEAVDAWMKPTVSGSDRNSCLSNLPRLAKGEAYYMQNLNDTAALVKFKVRAKNTYNSSRTPTVDEPEPVMPHLATVSRDEIVEAGQILGKVPTGFTDDENLNGFEE